MKRILIRTKAEKRIRNFYIVAFVLLLSSYLITLYANRQIIKQIDRVEHTNTVIRTLDNILSSVKDAETGVRGYVITANTRFLQPYYGTEKRADSLWHKAFLLTADNPQQQVLLNSLKKEIDRRFELFRFALSSYERNNFQRTDSMQRMQPESIQLMDNIRNTIGTMQEEENMLLKKREDDLMQSSKTITTITIVSLSLAFLLLFLGFASYGQLSRARKKALLEVEDYEFQLKKRIEELNAANDELVRIRRLEKLAATGRIARAIAHEVRNPLTNINLANDQLKSGQVEKQDEKDFLFEMIGRNSNRINQLIADLLNSTKFSELHYEKTTINDILEETLKEAEDRILLHKINIVKNYTGKTCTISVDKTKIKIAFLNIIINAIEAMEEREERVLTLTTSRENKKCRVVISDTGTGMDDESLARLFEAYFTNKPKGNGLGLTNTQNIILNHHGDISVESKKETGTSFFITLDVVD